MDSVEELLDTLRTIGSTGMTWWVYSTLLSVTILGFVWSKRHEIRDAGPRSMHGAFTLISVFFLSIVVFGGSQLHPPGRSAIR